MGNFPFYEGIFRELRKIPFLNGFGKQNSRKPGIDGNPTAVIIDQGEVISGFPPLGSLFPELNGSPGGQEFSHPP
jgi:hypothetical protein